MVLYEAPSQRNLPFVTICLIQSIFNIGEFRDCSACLIPPLRAQRHLNGEVLIQSACFPRKDGAEWTFQHPLWADVINVLLNSVKEYFGFEMLVRAKRHMMV